MNGRRSLAILTAVALLALAPAWTAAARSSDYFNEGRSWVEAMDTARSTITLDGHVMRVVRHTVIVGRSGETLSLADLRGPITSSGAGADAVRFTAYRRSPRSGWIVSEIELIDELE